MSFDAANIRFFYEYAKGAFPYIFHLNEEPALKNI